MIAPIINPPVIDLVWIVLGYTLLSHWWAVFCVEMWKLFRPINNQPTFIQKVGCYVMNFVGFPVSLLYANTMLLFGKYTHHIKGK